MGHKSIRGKKICETTCRGGLNELDTTGGIVPVDGADWDFSWGMVMLSFGPEFEQDRQKDLLSYCLFIAIQQCLSI